MPSFFNTVIPVTQNTYSAGSTSQTRVLGKDDFLRLLIVQLRNQDPLSPMKDEDFIAQMAQFSSLEQLQNMNDNLQTGINWDYLMSQSINNTMAASLIGKEVKALGDQIYFSDKGSVDIYFELSQKPSQFSAMIMDSSGQVIRTISKKDITPGEGKIEWDGKDDSGKKVAVGSYTVSFSATDENGLSIPVSSFTKGKVTGVRYKEGFAYLVVGEREISLDEVIEISLED